MSKFSARFLPLNLLCLWVFVVAVGDDWTGLPRSITTHADVPGAPIIAWHSSAPVQVGYL